MDYILEGCLRALELLGSGDSETYSAVATTIIASSQSILFSLIIGMPAGFILGYYSFPGKRQIRALVDTLLSLPTVLVGLLVYAFITKRGLLGEMGLEPERLEMFNLSSAEGGRFAEIVTEMSRRLARLGPSPLRPRPEQLQAHVEQITQQAQAALTGENR